MSVGAAAAELCRLTFCSKYCKEHQVSNICTKVFLILTTADYNLVECSCSFFLAVFKGGSLLRVWIFRFVSRCVLGF